MNHEYRTAAAPGILNVLAHVELQVAAAAAVMTSSRFRKACVNCFCCAGGLAWLVLAGGQAGLLIHGGGAAGPDPGWCCRPARPSLTIMPQKLSAAAVLYNSKFVPKNVSLLYTSK